MSKETKKEKDVEEGEVSEKFAKLIEEIEKMSVLDLSKLVKLLEKKFGVSAAAPVAMAAPATAAGGPTPEAEEKSVYNLELKGVGDKKIEVIKVVRDVTGKGLKEAKDIVDSAASSPQVIAKEIEKKDAEEMKKKFEAVGAQIELK